MGSLWLAVRLLTIVPTPASGEPVPAALGRSLVWYPLVGALLGLAVGGSGWLLAWIGAPPLLAAVLTVALAVILTGALHLDGLVDTCDGAPVARPPAERLAIMADPRVGTFGLAGGVGILLVKVAAIAALPVGSLVAVLVAAFAVSRAVMVGAVVLAPPARSSGLGAQISATAGRRELVLATISGATLVLLVTGPVGIVWAGVTAAVAWLIGRWLMRRLGGLTGDNFGALNEVAEALMLGLASWRGLGQ